MRIRPESPLHSDTIAVIAGNLIPIVGVVAAGWQPETLLFVYLAELATICLWAAVQTLFARKRPNNFLRRAVNDSRRRFELLGPLQQKRVLDGSVHCRCRRTTFGCSIRVLEQRSYGAYLGGVRVIFTLGCRL
ncbi:DUF6498-containing protein [Halomicroarcula sp. GCM10025324]|uniref:DUF6498-containing protein n=1 Tax=Haloarcula TaxID=2237 RepID=UPI0036150BAD